VHVEHFRRIVVVTPAQLGDVLLCTPLIRAARMRWPDARLDVLGFAGTLGFLSGNPDVDELIEIPTRGGRGAQLRQAWSLRRRYDLALVTRTGDRSHLYGVVCARTRSALVPGQGPGSRWKQRVAQHSVPPMPGTHQVMLKLELLKPWMDPPSTLSLLPPPSAQLPPAIEARIEHPCVVVHVPSMWRYKQWPPEHFRRVVEELLADDVQVILTGSSSSDDRLQVEQVLRGTNPHPKLLNVAGQLSLPQVRTLLQHADAYLGPDTSVTHLAAAVGVPIVTLFGPTDPQDFGPWPLEHSAAQPWLRRAQRQQVGNIVVLQGSDLPGRACVPCNRMGCEHRHDSPSHCLRAIEPQRVLAQLRRLLRRASAIASPQKRQA